MGRNKQQRLKENREIQRECNIQTIRDYEKKMDTLDEQIGKISLNIAALNKANRIGTFSLSYLEHVPEEAKLYSSVGKMFVYEQRDRVFSSLADSIEHTNDRIPKLRETLQKFDQRKREQSAALKELYESIQVSST
jgi:chaperonin cofactor prefoldin